jgi:regulator of sigma E protease
MCLIASIDWSIIPWWVPVIPLVALGLGAVIFVHELGHFAVAKLCGVKCEKFFIGFDIGGYKISRKWGETEYGIGILPLGGYVKMLGQDDNPANIAEQVRESQVAGNAVDAKEITGPDGKTYLVDRRSYLAKSVPQRMAIISAGVIMNVIFAFIFATVAYKLGVPYNPSIASGTAPGSPAWRADLRPGDEIVKVGDIEKPSYDDLRGSVMLGDLKNGIPFVIDRNGEEITKTLTPEQGSGLARVGIMPPTSLELSEEQPADEGSVAAQAKPPLEKGDDIVGVNGKAVHSYAEYLAVAARSVEQPLKLKVRHKPTNLSTPESAATGSDEAVVEIPASPWRTFGVTMPMGAIVAVQENSPAAAAKIAAGDVIERIVPAAGGDLSQDPLKLPEDLRRLADKGGEVKITLRPAANDGGPEQPAKELTIPLRKVDRVEDVLGPNDPVSIPALGLAYRVLNTIQSVEPGSPAEKAGLEKGDVVTSAEIVLPEGSKLKPADKPIDISSDPAAKNANWPLLMSALQSLPEGTKIKLAYERGEEKRTTEDLAAVAEPGYFSASRGLNFQPIHRIRIADSWAQAVQFGRTETVRSLSMVYRFLSKLGTRQVPATSLGGPGTIAQAAGLAAFEGIGKLLTFLTMLSANLAVINFLPIPLLDGGHMVFLAWEGLRGKPAGERFVVAMHTVGFVFIITLMLFVLSLDLGLIPRNL